MERTSPQSVDMQSKRIAFDRSFRSGKSTHLRSLNWMNDTIDIARVTGEIWYEGIDVNRPDIIVYEMRKHIDGFPTAQLCQIDL